jgi:hypothetical protein
MSDVNSQFVSWFRRFVAELSLLWHAVRCGFCGEKVVLGQVLLQRFLFSLAIVIPPMLHMRISFIYYGKCKMFSHGKINKLKYYSLSHFSSPDVTF